MGRGHNGLRFRSGPGEPWGEREEVEENSIARQNDPVHSLFHVEEERWHVDRGTPGELTIASCDPPSRSDARTVWMTLRFHSFGVPYEEPDLWALYDEASESQEPP